MRRREPLWKPCPFCGYGALKVKSTDDEACTWAVHCRVCNALGPEARSRRRARMLWNARDTESFKTAVATKLT